MTRPVSDVASFDLELAFNTPAFLGNATQEAQWRSPPFKALLRQWWRVVRAPAVGYDHRELLEEERRLFGAAGEEGGQAGRSRVQLRLSTWAAGMGERLPRADEVRHPEVQHRNRSAPSHGDSGQMVSAHLYLGYGPVTTRDNRSFIAPGATAQLRVRSPRAHVDEIARAVQLAAWFGSLGSRSRNGWGSLQVSGAGVKGYAGLTENALAEAGVLRPLTEALGDRVASEWPHAIGRGNDGRPAVWRVVAARVPAPNGQTSYEGFEQWRDVMTRLARIRIGLRTQFRFDNHRPPPHAQVEDRHVLAYPVTNHRLAMPGSDSVRLANQLCFKVLKHKNRYFGLIYHLPCAMPSAFFGGRMQPPPLERQIDVWRRVHAYLNGIGIDSDEMKVQRIR